MPQVRKGSWCPLGGICIEGAWEPLKGATEARELCDQTRGERRGELRSGSEDGG